MQDQYEFRVRNCRFVFEIIRGRKHTIIIIPYRLRIWGRVFKKQRWAVIFAIELIVFKKGFSFYII